MAWQPASNPHRSKAPRGQTASPHPAHRRDFGDSRSTYRRLCGEVPTGSGPCIHVIMANLESSPRVHNFKDRIPCSSITMHSEPCMRPWALPAFRSFKAPVNVCSCESVSARVNPCHLFPTHQVDALSTPS